MNLALRRGAEHSAKALKSKWIVALSSGLLEQAWLCQS